MAISHAFSNAVPDATGTLTIWYGATTATVAATDIVRPSNWNSAHDQYLTIAGNTAGQSTFSGSNIVIGGGPNITISGVNATRFDISAGAGGAGDGFNRIAAGTQTAGTNTTVVFANSNGISFGMSDSSQVTASYTVPTVTNSSWTVSDNGTSGTVARLAFTNLNGVTLSLSTGANGSHTIVGSHNALTSQSNQAFSAAGGSSAFQTLSFNNANGVSFSNNGGAVEASIATSLTAIRISAGTTSNLLSAVTFANGNGITFGLDASTVTASHNGLTSQSNQNVTAANGGFAFQTLSFSNVNGVSFGTSAGSAITASVAAQTNQTGGLYAVGNTTGQSSSSTFDARTLSFDGAGIVSVGWSNSTLRISATQSNQAFSAGAASSTFQTLSFQDSNGISFSNNAGAIRATYTRNVASNAIASVGSATNSGTNTSRFAADDHVHAGVFSVGVSNVGNTAGDTRVDVGRFVLAGGANITLSQATAAGALNTISIVAGAGGGETRLTAYAQSNTTQSSSGTIALSSLNFAGAGIASVGITNGSVVVSVPSGGGAGDGGVFAGVSTGGNTAGSTGTVSTGNFVLVGSNNITLSQSTGAAGSAATVTIQGPSRPRIEIYAPLAAAFVGSPTAAVTVGSYSNGTLFVQPLHGMNDVFPGDMTVDRLGVMWSAAHTNTTATTQAISSTVAFGIYTLVNATQLSRAFSGTMSWGHAAGNSNSSLYQGVRWITINSNQWDTQPTLSNTAYWIASFALSGGTSFSGQGPLVARAGITGQLSGFLGAASQSNASVANKYPFHGYLSASTNALPASIGMSNMIQTGSGWANFNCHFVLLGSNARSAMGIW